MSDTAKTPPQSTDDHWCQCGYRLSGHGVNHYACSLFKYSVMFNENVLPTEWVEGQKRLARKLASGRG